MNANPDEICAKPKKIAVQPMPSTMPIHTAAVYECESAQHAGDLLSGETDGFVYQRDGHPNAVVLAEQCRQLHGGEEAGVDFAVVTSTGMSAMSLAIVSHLKKGDHLLLGNQLYGRTTRLIAKELTRWGLEFDEVDMCNVDQVKAAVRPQTRMLVVETMANPLLHVADLPSLSSISQKQNAILLVDNTFATPLLTRPFAFGADLVIESMSKILNGHGDVMMGMLCGKKDSAERVKDAISTWGMTASPFDCWLVSRGLATAHLRIDRACENAMRLAQFLETKKRIQRVFYPGLKSHPTAAMATKLVGPTKFGNVLSCEFTGGLRDVEAFISLSKKIAFCPSLGEIATTISYPRTTSHRGLSAQTADKLGITNGVIRISCGIESAQFLENEFGLVLNAMDEISPQ